MDKTGERVIPEEFTSTEEYLMYLRHVFAYNYAKSKISSTDSVLEVGSGEGYGTSILSKKAKTIIGLDVDQAAINHAQRKYGNKDCIFKKYPGKKIPFDDNTFDKVISFQVIEHVEDDKLFITEIYRVLKKGGIFIVATPNRNHRLKPNQKPWNRFHLREYSPEDLAKLLSGKFRSSDIWGVFGNPEVQEMEINRVKKVRKMIALDPFGIRYILPNKAKLSAAKIARVLSRSKKSSADTSFKDKFDASSYQIKKKNIANSLDLLGVCKK